VFADAVVFGSKVFFYDSGRHEFEMCSSWFLCEHSLTFSGAVDKRWRLSLFVLDEVANRTLNEENRAVVSLHPSASADEVDDLNAVAFA
jgi:hypothetical protein